LGKEPRMGKKKGRCRRKEYVKKWQVWLKYRRKEKKKQITFNRDR